MYEKRKLSNGVAHAFNKVERFQSRESSPGPGYYETHKDEWNKSPMRGTIGKSLRVISPK